MDDMIRRIRALRAKSESTTFPAEADACRSKAEQLMAKHGIVEEQVAEPPPVQRQSIPQGWPVVIINGRAYVVRPQTIVYGTFGGTGTGNTAWTSYSFSW